MTVQGLADGDVRELAGAARAQQLRDQAEAGGLRFEAYLPPELATWLLALIARGDYADPSEAVFVILGEHRDLQQYPDLRRAALGRTLAAALGDPQPGKSIEQVAAMMAARTSRPRPEPARWSTS